MKSAAMPGPDLGQRGPRHRRRGPWRFALLGAVALLTACSIPERLDPRRFFRDNAPPPETAAGAETRDVGDQLAAEAASEPYPELAAVPARPAAVESSSRQQVVDGLIADRENARYTDEAIRLQEPAPNQFASNPSVFNSPGARNGEARVASVATPVASVVPPPAPAAVVAEAPPVPAAAATAATVRVVPSAVAAPLIDDPDGIRLAGGEEPPVEPQAEPLAEPRAVVPRRLPTTSARIAVPPPPTLPARPEALSADSFEQASLPVSDNGFANGTGRLSGSASHIATIQFRENSTGLTRADREILGRVVALLDQVGGALQVVGHSSLRTRQLDPIDHEIANLKVSEARANAVAQALIGLGVDPARVAVQARGDEAPLYDESMPTGEAGNRRTEVFIVR